MLIVVNVLTLWRVHMPNPSTHPSDPYIGTVLASRYQLTQLLGRGAMGRVYLAQDQQLGQVPVAVKLLAHSVDDPKAYQRFEREARAGACLGRKSIHIVRVNDFGLIPGDQIPFYVMEYVDGESLHTIINQGSLPVSRCLHLARHIALGLKAAHEGIQLDGRVVQVVHRDLKPGNVLVTQDDSTGELAKLLDFGIAKLLSNSGTMSVTHAYMGTLPYSSPEQLEGLPLDPRSDIYSFGIMLYQMISGDFPVLPKSDSFPGWYQAHHKQKPTPLDHYCDALPPALAELIYACLAKDPGDRPQSAAEVATELQTLNTHSTPDQPVPSSPLRDRRPATRSIGSLTAKGPLTAKGGTRRLISRFSRLTGSSKRLDLPPSMLERVVPLALGGVLGLGLMSLGWITVRGLVSDPEPRVVDSSPPTPPTTFDPYETVLQAGIQAYEKQNYEQAARYFAKAVDLQADSAEAQTWLQKTQTAIATASTPPPLAPTPEIRDPALSPELQGADIRPAPPPFSLQTFPVSIARSSVHAELGPPHRTGPGAWPHTVQDQYFYQLSQDPSGVELAFTYDQQSLAIQHTAATFNPQTSGTLGQQLLSDMLQAPLTPQLIRVSNLVQQGIRSQARFRYENLYGLIEQTSPNQLYIAIWSTEAQQAQGSFQLDVSVGDQRVEIQADMQQLGDLLDQLVETEGDEDYQPGSTLKRLIERSREFD